MNNKSQLLYTALMCILLLVSCAKDDPAGQNFVFDLEEEFELRLKENLSNIDSLGLDIELVSLSEFNCTNVGISTLANIFGGERIRVAVEDLLVPEICDEGSAPAVGSSFIGHLAPREYQITVTLVNEIENEGTLTVFPDHYEINIEEENGLTIPHSRLNKIPTQTIWGYVGYDNADIAIADELMADMLQFLQTTSLTSGNYGHFQLSEGGQVILPESENIKTTSYQTFVFTLNSTVDELQRKVEDSYCPQYQSEIDLKIYVANGTEIECL